MQHLSGDVQRVVHPGNPEAWETAWNVRCRFGSHQLQMIVETLEVVLGNRGI